MQNAALLSLKNSKDIQCAIGGDLASSRCRTNRFFVGRTVLHTFMQYSIIFYSRLQADANVISSTFVRDTVPDNVVNYRDPGLNRSREHRLQVVGDGTFHVNFRPEIAGDVISGAVLEKIGVDICVQGHHQNGDQSARRPLMMCSICGGRFTTPLFGMSSIDGPPMYSY